MLGDNIRKIRTSRKISINKLSELSGMSLGYLSDLENNKVNNPTLDKLSKIADALETTLVDLVAEHDSPRSDAERFLEYLLREAEENPELKQEIEEAMKGNYEGKPDKTYFGFFFDDSGDKHFIFNLSKNRIEGQKENEPITIAAHHDGDEWTEEELEEIESFKAYVKSKREKKNQT